MASAPSVSAPAQPSVQPAVQPSPSQRQLAQLKARALALLAQREHSETELRRKLLRQAQLLQRVKPAVGAGGAESAESAVGVTGFGPFPVDDEADQASLAETLDRSLDQVLQWLKSQGHLSETRFVESRVHSRAGRYGNQRIRQELAQHGLALPEPVAHALRDNEFERAMAVWQRKFQSGKSTVEAAGRVAEDGLDAGTGMVPGPQALRLAARDAEKQQAALWAKQARFLSRRGFSAEVVQRVIRQAREAGAAGRVATDDRPD